MTMNVPIAVRLSTPKGDMHVTRDLHDLSFRSTVPGGFASAQLSLSRPINIQPNEIAEYGGLHIYDRRNGSVLWEGRLEDSGRAAGDNGEIWQLTGIGPSAYATDRTESFIYVDGRAEGWRVGAQSIPSVDVQISEEAVKFGVANGTTHAAGYAGLAVYHNLAYTGQQLARVKWDFVPTFTSSNYECWLGTSIGTGGTSHLATAQVLGSNSQTASRGGATAIPAGHDTVRMRFVRVNTPLTPTDDNITIQFFPTVRGLLKWRDGNDITSGYNENVIYPGEVISDLLGRLLDRFDGDAAYVADDFTPIDQLAYPEGASAQKVLDDLMLLLPAYTWAAWHLLDSGKHYFEWRPWPTETRYEVSTVDGFDAPAQTGEVYNRVSVRWRDSVGASRIVKASSYVPALDEAGLIREAFVDISDEAGSAANAVQVGNAYLAEHAAPMNQGTLVINRPILDLLTSRYVAPQEIRPGNLIRVRNVLPRLDALNATTRDGVSTFKITSTEFNASTSAATLELDSYSPTIARAVARLNQRVVTRKR